MPHRSPPSNPRCAQSHTSSRVLSPPLPLTDTLQVDSRMPSWRQRHVFPSKASLCTDSIVYTALNLVGLYHDALLAKAVAGLPPSVRTPEPSPHNRYTRFWLKANPNYKRLALAIVIIQYAEVLLEMGTKKKWGDKGRWRTIVGIEALKYQPP
jgi:Peroxisomal membrane protein (Pex16)